MRSPITPGEGNGSPSHAARVICDRLERATRWLIPPLAGLYQLSVDEETAYAAFLDLSFAQHGA